MGRDRSRSRGERRDRSRSRERRDRSRSRDKKDRSRDRSRDRGDRSSKKEEKEHKDDDVFRVGRQVIVKGLQKNPEKNGSIGSLVEFNAEKARWVVALGSGNNNFKEENLELMPDNSDVIDEKEEPPTAKIYITKLTADTTEADLLALFKGVGVIAKEKPKESRNRGFEDQWPFAVKLYKPGRENGDGCLTFQDPQAAKAAIKTYNRYKFKGSKIGVAYAGVGRTFENVELTLPWHMRPENQGKLDRESGGGGGGGGGDRERKPGDWNCTDCGAEVFASRDTCFKCGSAKPGGGGGGGKDGGKGGKDGGKDSGKGGKAGDWTCPGCNANVFASKDSCFKCGEVKPGGGGGGKGKGKDDRGGDRGGGSRGSRY